MNLQLPCLYGLLTNLGCTLPLANIWLDMRTVYLDPEQNYAGLENRRKLELPHHIDLVS